MNTDEDLLSEYFSLGQQESVSPFLEPSSRQWSANLTLKASLVATCLLTLAFLFSFFPSLIPLGHMFLVGVYFFAGIPALIEAVEDLLAGEINIDILMTLAAFSSVFIGSGMEGGLLLVLFALSGAMEDAVTARAKSALNSLHKLAPTKASVLLSDGTLMERSIRDISVGSHILVKAGQVVPLDGQVIAGTSSVNLVHLTGESLPVTKTVGDTVPAGGRNQEGALTLAVTQTSGESTIAKIVALVTQAHEARPRLQRWFDQASRAYAITIIGLSLFFALSLPYLLHIPFLGYEGAVYRAVAFLIAASPCALIIAIPIAYLSAISACARKGILLKGGVTLDALTKCRAIAFDKTGTLTSGNLRCLGIESLTNQPTDKAVAIAYSLEKNAVHPIASAIIQYAKEQNISPMAIQDFKSYPGFGVEGVIEKQIVRIGKIDFVAKDLGVSKQLQQRIQELESQGELLTVLVIANDPFIFRFRDEPRPLVADMLKAIHQRGMKTYMLTGDHVSSAQRVAEELQVDVFYAGLTPEEKLHYVTELSQHEGLAMIGDGVNDAPALARATVGIAMGKVGSGAATDAADIVLLHDNIELLDWLIGKAGQTQAVVRQNLAIAIGAICVAALPSLAGFVPLWMAVVLHEGGTVLVGLNALRLLRKG